MDIYSQYKPLRNFTRHFDIVESLSVIQVYYQHLQFKTPLSSDINAPSEFINTVNKLKKNVFEWELDLLTREIIINGTSEGHGQKSLKEWGNFSKAINIIRNLENSIASTSPDLKKHILLEMHRISHRQFPWQTPPNASWMTRYYKIFRYPALDQLLQEVIGLSTKEIYRIGLFLTGFFLDKFALIYPQNLQSLNISKEKFDIFLRHFSRSFEEIKEKTIESQKYDFDYAYLINPLRIFPLIELIYKEKKCHIAPIPTFLIWRFTEGIYYEICNSPKFANPFGESFQKYTGEVLEQTKNPNQNIFYEEEYYVGRNRKDTVDWILQDDKCVLFIECKTKKIKSASQTSLTNTSSLKEDLDKMADFTIQVYKQIFDFKNGHYPNNKFGSIENIFPFIITITEWYSLGNPKIKDILEKKIIEKLSKLPIGMHNYFKIYPYTICSINEFEKATQIIAIVGANHFMSNKTDTKYKFWEMKTFIHKIYPTQLRACKNLFQEDFETIISPESF